MTNIQKRFIAGATCPQCQLIDKIVVFQQDGIEHCECVRCGHAEQQNVTAKPIKAKVEAREQTIRLVRR